MLHFELRRESTRASVLVMIRGDLDVQVAERATDELTLVEARWPDPLVLDLRDVSFMDSTGMAVIAGAHARAAAAGRRFAVVAPPAGVRQAFELSGLDELVTIVDDVARVYPDWSA